jgi:hypothetical protein
VASESKTKEIYLFLCLLPLKPGSPADIWHARSWWFSTLSAKPFNQHIHHNPAHVIAISHTICNVRDINVSLHAAPAVLAAVMICFVIAFLGLSNIKTSRPFRKNIPHTVHNNPTKWIINWGCHDHPTSDHNSRCPPMCTFLVHQCVATFPTKSVFESLSPLVWLCDYYLHIIPPNILNRSSAEIFLFKVITAATRCTGMFSGCTICYNCVPRWSSMPPNINQYTLFVFFAIQCLPKYQYHPPIMHLQTLSYV